MPLLNAFKSGIFYVMTKLFFSEKIVDKLDLCVKSVYNSVDIVDNLLFYEVFAY